MKLKQLQILSCLFFIGLVVISCRQDSLSFNPQKNSPFKNIPRNNNSPISRGEAQTHSPHSLDVNNGRHNHPLDINNERHNHLSLDVPEDISKTADWEERINRWAERKHNELDNGTLPCDAWTVIQCKLVISEYKQLALNWIKLPLFEREMQRFEGTQDLYIKSKFKKFLFGKGTTGSSALDHLRLGEEFLNILDEVEREDQKSIPTVIRNIIDNEVYPSLSDTEKIHQWATDAWENYEREIESSSWLNKLLSSDNVYAAQLRETRSFLEEWIQKTPDERDAYRKVPGEGRAELGTLYRYDETLRALWQLIEARDMLSRPERQREYQRDLQERYGDIYQSHFTWLGRSETEKLEIEELESEEQRREKEERVSQWQNLSFEEREALRQLNEGIMDQINIDILPIELIEQIKNLEESDLQTRNELRQRQEEERQAERERQRQQRQREQEAQQQIERQAALQAQRLRAVQEQINSWRELSFEAREAQRKSNQSLTDQIDNTDLPHHLRQAIVDIEESDTLHRNQLARTELNKQKNMSYEERLGVEKLEDTFEVWRLSEELQNEIRQLRERDREIRNNRKRANEWAAAKARTERLQVARQNIENPSLMGYRQAKVKLWPIRCYNKYNPVYPFTDDTKPIHVNLSSRDGLQLEVHRNGASADDFMLIAGRVEHVKLQVNNAYDLYNAGNYIEYTVKGETKIYRLNRLIDIESSQTVYYVRVRSSEDAPIRLRWEEMWEKRGKKQLIKVDRDYRGDFRIEITGRRSSDRSEWSLINELPIEWYMRSVIGSEVPGSYTINAHLAQAVAGRSYFLNKAVEDRRVQARGWDIDPTQCNQTYRGIEQEREKSDLAVSETAGQILTYNDRLAKTQYYACGRRTTKNGIEDNGNPIEAPRNIPSNITCSIYPEKLIDNHGYGMPQYVANKLTEVGWENTNGNSPTEGTKLPEDIHKPWLWKDVLLYFYRGEHPNVQIQDFRNL